MYNRQYNVAVFENEGWTPRKLLCLMGKCWFTSEWNGGTNFQTNPYSVFLSWKLESGLMPNAFVWKADWSQMFWVLCAWGQVPWSWLRPFSAQSDGVMKMLRFVQCLWGKSQGGTCRRTCAADTACRRMSKASSAESRASAQSNSDMWSSCQPRSWLTGQQPRATCWGGIFNGNYFVNFGKPPKLDQAGACWIIWGEKKRN